MPVSLHDLGAKSSCEDVIEAVGADRATLAGCSVLLTGATSGLGRQTCVTMASLGATVVCGVRNTRKANALAADVHSRKLSGTVKIYTLELSSTISVRKFAGNVIRAVQAGEIPPLRTLVLNAGRICMSGPTANEGIETTFAVNHLSHWLLTKLLLPTMHASGSGARVIAVGSASHFGPLATGKQELDRESVWLQNVVYPRRSSWSMRKEALEAYGSSKLANTLFASELHRREAARDDGLGVRACSLHPGNMIATGIGRESWVVTAGMRLGRLLRLTKSVSQGAATTLRCVLCPIQELRGDYWSDCQPTAASWRASGANGRKAAAILWDLSERLCRMHNTAMQSKSTCTLSKL